MNYCQSTARLVALLVVACVSGCMQVHQAGSPDNIPVLTPELTQQLNPWCPNKCAKGVPHTAIYRNDNYELVFVGTFHVFTPRNKTIEAVDSGFSETSANILIVEGFPTAMGENPAPLIEQARTVGTPDAIDYARGEMMYAITIALKQGMPFVGGEPTRAQQVQRLQQKGYTSTDIAFSYLIGGLSQSLRAGYLASQQDSRLTEVFSDWAGQFEHQFQLEAMTYAAFSARYQATYGVSLTNDSQLVQHASFDDTSFLSVQNRTGNVVRDEHLLETILDQLAEKKRVIVVYGADHWTTLSRALEQRLGEPTITPFLQPQ